MTRSRSLAKTLGELERERRERVTPANALMLAIGLPSLALFLATFFAGGLILPWVLLAPGAIMFVYWVSARREVARSFKRRIIPGLIGRIDARLAYSADGMDEGEFRSYGLFRDPDRYRSQDLVAGIAGKTPIRFAMIHAEERHGSGRNERYSDILKGLLFVARFNKRLRATTRVASGEADFLDALSDEHVQLEDARFNELYTVSSTDQVEARYVLTPDMMERFVALRRDFDRINVAFYEDKLALALDTDYDLLDPDVDAQFDVAQAEALLAELKALVGIVEALDLDTRIWTVK